MKNIDRYDEILKLCQNLLRSRNKIFKNAQNNLSELKSKADNKFYVKYSTQMSGIGMFDPSLIRFKIDNGFKKGRLLHEKPQNEKYCECEFDEDDNIIRLKKFNKFGCDCTWYFFENGQYKYAVPFFRESDCDYETYIYRCEYYPNNCIKNLARIDLSQILYEVYDYSLISQNIIFCDMYEYLEYIPENYNTDIQMQEKINEFYLKIKSIVNTDKITFPNTCNEVKFKSWRYKIYLSGEKVIKVECI